jgi:hypothetical protein
MRTIYPERALNRLILYSEGSVKSIPIMKEALVNKDVSVEIVDSPTPKPGPGQLLIKVVVAGTS